MLAMSTGAAGAEPAPYEYLKRSNLEHEAAAMLRRDGCEVFRTDGRRPGVNLIGMVGRGFRFVCIRRRRYPAGPVRAVAEDYADDLKEIRRYLSPVVTAELWIWATGDGWRRFRIYAGGIQEIGGGGRV